MEFTRQYEPKKGKCFIIMPYGKKRLDSGEEFDWDTFYKEFIKNAIEDIGMEPVIAGSIYETDTILESVWKGIQEAEIIIADLTGQNPNVLYELGLAHVIGKRVVLLARKGENIPQDIVHTKQVRYDLDNYLDVGRFKEEFKKCVSAARNEPTREMMLQPYQLEQINARIIFVEPKHALVEAADGRRGILYPEDVDWGKEYPDLSRKYKIGDQLSGAFVTREGQTKYSLIAGTPNPWPEIESKFPPGTRFTTNIKNCVDGLGVFVVVKYDISSLIHDNQLPKGESLNVGDELEVETEWIDPKRRRIGLKYVSKVKSAELEPPWEPPYSVGEKLEGIVHRLNPEKNFILVSLPKYRGILHASNMSTDFLSRFEHGEIQVGSPVAVEVIEIDMRKKSIQLRNIQ